MEKVCGQGGFTTVYRAIDPRLARRVAVRVLDRAPAEDAAELGSHFFNEAKLVAKLNHPAILPVYNCGVFEGMPFLVTRYMAGGTLGMLLESGGLPPPGRLVEIVRAVAEALQYAARTATAAQAAAAAQADAQEAARAAKAAAPPDARPIPTPRSRKLRSRRWTIRLRSPR